MLPLLGESNIDEVFEVGFASLSVAKLLSLIQSAQSCSVFQAKCFCFVRFFKRMRVMRRCENTIICSCWYGLPFRLSTTSKKSILVMSHDIIGAIYLTTSILSTKTQAASPQLPLMTWEVPYQQPLRALRCWMRPFAFRAFTNHAWMPEAFWMSLEWILFATILDVEMFRLQSGVNNSKQSANTWRRTCLEFRIVLCYLCFCGYLPIRISLKRISAETRVGARA